MTLKLQGTFRAAGRRSAVINGRRVAVGDRVNFRGLYEWNDLGGLVHWTHEDPMGKEDGGWVRYRNRVYA